MNFLNCCLQKQLRASDWPRIPKQVREELLLSGGLQGSGEKVCALDRQQAALWSLFHHTVVSASA